MSVEKPSKTICEICGDTHVTATHADSSKNATEAKHELEMEPNHEAMKKVVDIFTAEDLKYRAYDPFITTLETGVPTPETSFLKEPFGRLDEDTRDKIRKKIKNLDQERMKQRTGTMPFDDLEEGARFRQANVFYPEGLLKALRDHISGTKTIEIWSEDYFDEADYEDVGWAFATEVILEILKKLPASEQEKIAHLLGRSIQQFDTLNHPVLQADRPLFDPWDPDPDPDAKTLNRWEEMRKDNKLMNFLQDLLTNSEAFEILRKAWLKKFFEDTNPPKEFSKEFYEDEDRRMVHDEYAPNYGFILSPSAKVAVAPQREFPTQATILSPRVSQKKFIGIFVNSDYSDRYDYITDEAIHLDVKENRKEGLSMQKQLEHAVFKTPNSPFVYLLSHYPRPFFIFLEQQGFKRDKLVKIFENFSVILDEKNNKSRKEVYWGSTKHAVDNAGLHRALNERSFVIDSQMVGLSDREEYQHFQELAKRFIEEQSPIKDGETLWTGLIRLAQQHQLPVYNLRGELLWPKHITHDEVVKLVAEKPEEDK